MATDPVCGMTVGERTAKFSTVHEGKTYYFCSPGCYNDFKANPRKYAK